MRRSSKRCGKVACRSRSLARSCPNCLLTQNPEEIRSMTTSSANSSPVVRSLLENDLYKFTMWQALLHSHPGAQAEYAFVCRNVPAYPLSELKDDVDAELDRLCTLSFGADELAYLRSLRFIKSDFVDFLTVFRFQRRFVEVSTEGDQLRVVARGPLVHVMAFEIFVLYIRSELYFRRLPVDTSLLAMARNRLNAKITALKAERASLVSASDPFVFRSEEHTSE